MIIVLTIKHTTWALPYTLHTTVTILPLSVAMKCSRIRQEKVNFCSFGAIFLTSEFFTFMCSVFVQLLICCSVCLKVLERTIKQFVAIFGGDLVY